MICKTVPTNREPVKYNTKTQYLLFKLIHFTVDKNLNILHMRTARRSKIKAANKVILGGGGRGQSQHFSVRRNHVTRSTWIVSSLNK